MECWGVRRAFQHRDVRIGWAPWVAVRPTQIRSKPDGGTLLKSLHKYSGLGYQSVRNPTGSPSPPLRLPVTINGGRYAWVYSRFGDVTGWVKLDDIERDLNSAQKPPLNGPGGYDFEIDRTLPLPKLANSCGKPSLTRPLRVVTARDTYLRYSPRGTAFHFLHAGDIVKLLLVNAEGRSFAFCEIVRASDGSTVYPGYRGWVWQNALGPITPGSRYTGWS